MRIQTTFDQDFEELYNRYNINEKGKTLLDIEGISRDALDIGVMSKKYFTNKISDISLDANSNSNDEISHNNYSAEIVKGLSKLNSYYLLHNYAKGRFGLERANELLKAIFNSSVYFHDAASTQIPYCMAYSTSFIMNEGRQYGQLRSLPPKRASSFLAQVIETTMDLSQNFAGAIAVSDLIVNLCYYTKKENLDNYQILNLLQGFVHVMSNKFRVGGQCVDEHTEILTPDGFKKYNEINTGDLIYTWKDGSLNIENIQKVNIYEYEGPMHLYKGRDIIQQVTPNHLVLHMKNNYGHRKFTGNNKYELSPSNDLINKKTSLQIPVATERFDRPDYDISDELLQLAVIILTDGTIESKGNHKHVHIYKSPKRYGNDLIQKLLNNLEIKYTMTEKQNKFFLGGSVLEYYINLNSVHNIIKNLNKTCIPKWAFLLSRRQAKLFIDTWALFDGQTLFEQYNKQKLQCDSIEIANDIQHICVLAGLGSHLISRVINNKNKVPTIYVLPYNRSVKSCQEKEIINYKGITWCPTTESGIVIYRKEGRVFISGNSPFTNLSIFDRPNLEKLFEHYTYPDGTHIDIDYVLVVEKAFAEWFAEGDPSSGLPYRFPICTINLACDKDKNIIDQDFLSWVSKVNLKNGTFNLYINSGNKIASCCRLLSDTRMEARGDSFGNGGLNIGSHRVVTINLPRISLKANKNKEKFFQDLNKQLEICRDLLLVHREEILKRRIDQGFLKFFKPLGWFNLERLFSTFGIIGICEMNYFMGFSIQSEEGIQFTTDVLNFIENFAIKTSNETHHSFNVEEIPGESVASKLVEKDKVLFGEDKIPFQLYSNQYIPLITDASLPERIELTGKFMELLSGGGILHLNIKDRITNPTTMKHLIEYSVSNGVSHISINYSFGECLDGHITVCGTETKCPLCGKEIISHMTRIVGYFTKISSWGPTRREYEFPRRVFS